MLGAYLGSKYRAAGPSPPAVDFRLARRLDAGEFINAHVLLGGTILVGAGVVAVLALAFAGNGAIDVIPTAILNVAGTAVAALIIAVVLPSRRLRVVVFSSIVLCPVLVLDPALWWAGVAFAFVLLVAVEVVPQHAREMVHVPGPALTACLVTSVVALPLLAVYGVVRLLLFVVVRPEARAREHNVSPGDCEPPSTGSTSR